MLKGVNKQIIEVTDTGNQYIRKAILFIDPEKKDYDGAFLVHQAKRYLQQAEQGKEMKPTKQGRWKKFLWSLAQIGAGVAAGSVIAMLCMK